MEKLFCVAVYIPAVLEDDADGILHMNCTTDGLVKLKNDDDLGYLELLGWLPIEYYNGYVSENDEHFIHW